MIGKLENDELAALEQKLDAGTITDLELKRMVKLILLISGLSRA